MTRTTIARYTIIIAGAAALAACKGGAPADRGTEGGQSTAQHDSVLAQQNATLAAEKDSLFAATRSLLAAMASIDSATTLAGVKPAKQKGEPILPYEEQVRARTVTALARLRATQARLGTALARISRLSGQNSAMGAELDSLRATIDALQGQIATETARGDSLVAALRTATARGDTLERRTIVLGGTIDSMARAERRVWYVAGTKDYLMKNSIVAEVGGTRFPFIVKVGATLRPANLHPDTTLFHPLDMLETRTIPLDAGHSYEVISAQDLNGADRSNAKGRVFTGPITITDPQRFWAPSHYLILMER